MPGFLPPVFASTNEEEALRTLAKGLAPSQPPTPEQEGQALYNASKDQEAAAAAEAEKARGPAMNGMQDQKAINDVGGDPAITSGISASSGAANEISPIEPVPQAKNATVWGGRFSEPFGGEERFKEMEETAKQAQGAVAEAGEAGKQQADDEYRQLQIDNPAREAKYAENERARADEHAQGLKMLADLKTQSDAIASTKLQKGQLFNNPLTVLSAIMVSFTPLIGGDPQAGVKMIDQAIQRDLDVQQANINQRWKGVEAGKGIFQDFMNLTNNAEQARLRSEAYMKENAAKKMEEIAAKYKGKMIDADTQMKIATLRAQANQNLMMANRMAFRDFQAMPKPIASSYGPTTRPHSLAAQSQTDKLMGQANNMMQGYKDVLAGGPQGVNPSDSPAYIPPKKANPLQAKAQELTGQGKVNKIPEVTVRQGGGGPTAGEAEEGRVKNPLLQKWFANNPIGKKRTPGLQEEMRLDRARFMNKTFIQEINAGKTPEQALSIAQNKNLAETVKAQAAQAKIAQPMLEHAAINGALADVQQKFNTVRAALGSDDAVDEFLSGARAGKLANKFDQYIHEFAQRHGWSDEKAKEYYNFMQQIAFVNLQHGHNISGGALSPTEIDRLNQFLNIDTMSASSIRNSVNILSRAQENKKAIAVQLGESPRAALIWMANNSNQHGTLSTTEIPGR